MSPEDNGNELLLLFQGCKVGISREKRFKICKTLLNLVNTQHIRDVETFPPEMYRFLLESIRLGWSDPGGDVQCDAQAVFAGIMHIPEFEIDVARNFVDDGFLMELCSQFQDGVSEERFFLRDTLYWAYASFPHKRVVLREQIGSALGQFVRTPSRSFLIQELLQVLRQIIQGFPSRLTQVHRSLLTGVILPLHEPNQMAVWGTQQPLIEIYHETLVGCLVPFLEKQPDLVQVVLEAIAAAWPEGFSSNTPKEVLLLHEIETLIQFVPPEGCGEALDVIMPKILGCLRVDHSRVVERALFLFKDEKFINMLATKSHTFFMPTLSALLRGGEPFWNPTVTKMTVYVLESLEEKDSDTYAAACESLWGEGLPSVSIDNTKKYLVTPPTSRETPSQPAKGGEYVPPTSLKGAMGSWRPPAGIRSRQAGASKTARNPPAAVTGVAPWAFQSPIPPVRLQGLQPTKNNSERIEPPAQSLQKKGRLGAPEATEDVREKGISRDEKSKVGENLPPLCEGKPDGRGLQKVRDFILKIKPTEKDETFGLSWQELQLEPTPTLLPDLRFHDLVFGHELGQGSFSVVKYARLITSGKSRSHWPEFAVKVVSTTKIQELNYEKSVTNEIACLRILSHPGIARLISAFRWRDGAYLVLEYASRGDLHSHIKHHGSLSEASTRFVVGEVLAALCSVHDCGFLFGDLKPENIIITESGHVKIADFGACRPVTAAAKKTLSMSRDALQTLRDGDWRVAAGLPPNPLYTYPVKIKDSDSDSDSDIEVGRQGGGSTGKAEDASSEDERRAEGTAAYMPPEVARGSIPGLEADSWALGCVTFLCLAGRPPIFAETDEAIIARVVKFTLGEGGDFPALPPVVSAAPRSLVRALMEPDPQKRLGVEHAVKHDFFVHDGMDVYSLHRQKPPELARGTVAPAPNAAWSRRQNSMIWAPMPQEYRFDVVAQELTAIPETVVERGAAFRRQFSSIREPPLPGGEA